jgi:hypothetical protein
MLRIGTDGIFSKTQCAAESSKHMPTNFKLCRRGQYFQIHYPWGNQTTKKMNPILRLSLIFVTVASLNATAQAQKGTLEEQFAARVTALIENSTNPDIADERIQAYRDSVVARHPGKAAALDQIIAARKSESEEIIVEEPEFIEVLVEEEEPVFIDLSIEEEEVIFMDQIVEEEPAAIPPPPPPPARGPGSIEIFNVVEKMPLFPGCAETITQHERDRCTQDKLREYIISKLVIPEGIKKAGEPVRIIAQFIVERDGSVSGASVVRSSGGAIDAEVVQVIESMNSMPVKWTPGNQRGVPVRVQYTLPLMIDADE